jgi:hypothetical protein
MRAPVYLAFVLSIFNTVACSQAPKDVAEEKPLIKAIDQFTNANGEQWNDFEKMMTSSSILVLAQRLEEFNNNPFIKAFNTFTQENTNRYAAVRAAKFAQYATPPPALLALNWDTTGQSSPVSYISHINLFSVVFIRTFDPSMIAQITNSFVASELLTGLTSEYRSRDYYRARDLFGTRVYTRLLTGNIWQVWAADRSLAISFQFDAGKGIVSAVSHTALHDPALVKIQWTHSIAKPANETARLMDDIFYQIWSSYPANGYDGDSYDDYQQSRKELATNFLQSQNGRYETAREEQLRTLDQPPAQLTNFKELTTAEDDLLHNSDSTYNAATVLFPQQWGTIIGISAVTYFQMDTKAYAKRVQRNAIFGSNTYARRLNDNEWEVWTISAEDASSCIWNIRSGYAKKARYWVLEEKRS